MLRSGCEYNDPGALFWRCIHDTSAHFSATPFAEQTTTPRRADVAIWRKGRVMAQISTRVFRVCCLWMGKVCLRSGYYHQREARFDGSQRTAKG